MLISDRTLKIKQMTCDYVAFYWQGVRGEVSDVPMHQDERANRSKISIDKPDLSFNSRGRVQLTSGGWTWLRIHTS